MKKLKLTLTTLLLIATMLLGLVACGNTQNTTTTTTTDNGGDQTPAEAENVNVMVFTGTTGFGMAPLMDKAAKGEAANKYTFSLESTDVQNVIAALINGSVDIAALPTNAASLVYNSSEGDVQLLALNTKGVLYLVETGDTKTVDSFEDLKGKTVCTPVQNPAFVFEALCRKNGLIPGEDIFIDSTYAPADLKDLVASGEVEYAILPEPMVTIAQKTAANAGNVVNVSLDITSEWNKAYNNECELIQGCVVVRKAFAEAYPETVRKFLAEYEESINFVNENPEEASQMIADQKIFAQAPIAKLAIPKCNIFFASGEDMKDLLAGYLEALYEVKPASVGGKLPDDGFYYVK